MKRSARLFALALAVLMLAPFFTACKGGGEAEATTTPSGSSTTSGTGSTTTTAPVTTEPPPDVTGYEFVFSMTGYLPEMSADGTYPSQIQQEFGDKIAALEERLGCTFVTQRSPSGSQFLYDIVAATASGDQIYDAMQMVAYLAFQGAKNGWMHAVDGDTLKNAGLNCFDEQLWDQPLVKANYIFGQHWGVQTSSIYNQAMTGFFILFNKQLCAEAGYDDMYQLVREKKWNWDVYREITKKATNANEGTFGTAMITAPGAELLSHGSIENTVAWSDAEGKYILAIDNPAGLEGLQFIADICVNDNSMYPAEDAAAARQFFADGKAAFAWTAINRITPGTELYASVHDYGVLPLPLGPGASEYVSAYDNCRILVCQITHKAVDKWVYIMNEWAAITHDPVFGAILDDGRVRSEQDKEIFDEYIYPTLAQITTNATEELRDTFSEFLGQIKQGNMTPAQALESYRGELTRIIDDFYNS